ncbi:MAG: FMN-binding negative transcriptional regulator, partial [Planctomycetota bacterium]
MYLPESFAEPRPQVRLDLICHHPFATVVSAGKAGLCASHVP